MLCYLFPVIRMYCFNNICGRATSMHDIHGEIKTPERSGFTGCGLGNVGLSLMIPVIPRTCKVYRYFELVYVFINFETSVVKELRPETYNQR